MPRYKLRTLLIVLALGPPVLAGVWYAAVKVNEEIQRRQTPGYKYWPPPAGGMGAGPPINPGKP